MRFPILSRRALTPLALTLLLFLSGCGDSDTDKPPANNPQAEAEAPTRHGDGVFTDGVLTYPASDFHESEAGKPGGFLRASTGSDTNSLNVHAISHGSVQWLGRFLFDTLIYQDEAGNPSPWLAKSWEISPDGLIYTFHLREGVTFSDGEKFNAEAVLVNLEHMRAPATRSPLAAPYIAPYRTGRVVDEYTFEATLSEPYAPFLDVLAQSWLGMISPRQIRGNPSSIAEHPIGTGPFVLERYVRGQGASFTRRNDYAWAPDIVRHKGPAYLERIQLDIVPEAAVRYGALASGQHDLTFDMPPQHAADVRQSKTLRVYSRIRKGNPTVVASFNTERPPFDDVRVRRAVVAAIDREGIAWMMGFGEYLPKHNFYAANSRYYDPSLRNALRHDPELANRLLDEAGWQARDKEGYRVKDGKRLGATQLLSAATATSPQVVIAMQNDLKAIGFELRTQSLSTAQLIERRYSPQGDYDMFGGGYWHTNTPDALYIYYHSNSITTERLIGHNTFRLRDAQLDEWLAEARRSADPALQESLYRKAQARLIELVPGVPAFESQVLVAHHGNVHVPVFDSSHNVPFITSIWMEPKQK
ncbi:MAG: ABC transporter substrate-binding protein [Zoogloeaceae bacterium]|jgi:peptide/nickel transport system substrate-binding protein|nr:ABC transporter substrate-binding protein [Zoogloeaceae bacterium]